MDVQLKDLIDKIKAEGIQEAEALGAELKKEAERHAAEIIENARKKADEIIKNGKEAAIKFENAAGESLKQAGRNLILSLENTIKTIMNSIILREVRSALSGDFLREIISSLLKNSGNTGKGSFEIMVSPGEAEMLNDFFLKKLSDELKDGIIIKPVPGIEAGFRISEKSGSLYYDFTAAGITEFMLAYLNPNLADYMRKVSRGE